MEERARRIVDTAIQLAEEGGFEAVRLRDVAAHAGVALGTVYKRFKSKEDILVAAISREADNLELLVRQTRVSGDTCAERGARFFDLLTRVFLGKPNFARAVLRSIASGEPAAAGKIAAYQQRVANLITAAVWDEPVPEEPDPERNPISFLLQQVWFANLVGWMGGLHTDDEVIAQMRFTVELVFRNDR